MDWGWNPCKHDCKGGVTNYATINEVFHYDEFIMMRFKAKKIPLPIQLCATTSITDPRAYIKHETIVG